MLKFFSPVAQLVLDNREKRADDTAMVTLESQHAPFDLQSKRVAGLIDVPENTVSAWLRTGLLKAPKGYARERRLPVSWSADLVLQAFVIARLRKSGIDMKLVRKLAEADDFAEQVRGIMDSPGFFVVVYANGSPELLPGDADTDAYLDNPNVESVLPVNTRRLPELVAAMGGSAPSKDHYRSGATAARNI